MGDVEKTADSYSAAERGFMLFWQRTKGALFGPLIRLLTRLGVSANFLTLLALSCGLVASALLPAYHGWALLVLALHVILDGLDGPLARHQGTISSRGSLIDTVADQIAIVATTAALIFAHAIEIWIGISYICTYTLVVVLATIRNALGIPYAFLIRPRYFVYAWLPVEFYALRGSLSYVMGFFTALLALSLIGGVLKICRRN